MTRVCAGSAVKMQTCINFCETATILTSFWEENFERTLNFQAFSVFALLEFFSAQKLNWNGQNWFGNVIFKFQTILENICVAFWAKKTSFEISLIGNETRCVFKDSLKESIWDFCRKDYLFLLQRLMSVYQSIFSFL